MFIMRTACAVSPDAFPVPTGFFIWIPNEPYLFNEHFDPKKHLFTVHQCKKLRLFTQKRIKCRSQSGSQAVQLFWQQE